MQGDTSNADLIAVFMQMRGRLRAIARSIVNRGDLADEVLQDAYVKLSQLTEMPGIARPEGYCAQTVRNLAMDYQRRHGTEATYRIFVADAETIGVSTDAGPDRMLGLRQALEQIDRVLSTLPPRTRHAFELYRLGEMTQRDIGKRLGCSASVVNQMLKEADVALRACRHLLE
ncbi:MAG: sigma-70 family RNA polymerase sigma factor [Acidovorax sp.]